MKKTLLTALVLASTFALSAGPFDGKNKPVKILAKMNCPMMFGTRSDIALNADGILTISTRELIRSDGFKSTYKPGEWSREKGSPIFAVKVPVIGADQYAYFDFIKKTIKVPGYLNFNKRCQ